MPTPKYGQEVVPELVGNEVAVPRPMPSGW